MMEEALIMELWDLFREYIPDKNKDMAANQYVDFLLGKDISPEVLETFMGYDPNLDDAIKTVVDEYSDGDSGDDYDEDNFGYEDEDY
jgi:hypothetical protein